MADTATEPNAEKVTTDDLDKAANEWTENEVSKQTEGSEDIKTEETGKEAEVKAGEEADASTSEADEVDKAEKVDVVDPDKVDKVEKKADPQAGEFTGRRLGKKVESLKAQMDELQRTLTAQTVRAPQVQETEDDFVLPDTKSEFEKMVATQVTRLEGNRAIQMKADKVKYEYDYLAKLEVFEKDPSFQEVTEELFQNNSSFNKSHERNGTWDGALDAEINYANAKNFILQKKLTELSKPKAKENPLKGKAAAAPLGVGGDTRVGAKTEKTPTLDAAAQSFVDHMRDRGEKMSDSFIKKAMERPDTTSVRG